MRVLFVTHGVKDPDTAVYRNILERAGFIRGLGHDPHVLTPEDVHIGHGPLRPLLYPVAAAWWIFRRRPFDVVMFHSHTGCVFQLLRAIVPKHRRTRVAVGFHGLDILYVRALAAEGRRSGRPQRLRFRLLHQTMLPRLARWSCRRAESVFCMNEQERAYLVDAGWVGAGRLRSMPNCVDLQAPMSRPCAAGAIRMLSVAQWLPVKGTRYLVDAFTGLVRQGHDLHLTCAGTGLGTDLVLRDFPEDVRQRVAVIPRFRHGSHRALYASADIFVLSSLFEGFSHALLEAMASGLGIVTTDAGAARELLEHDRDALIVGTADAAALQSAIAVLALDHGRRTEYGRRARLRAEAFACERVHSQFVEDLLGAGAGNAVAHA